MPAGHTVFCIAVLIVVALLFDGCFGYPSIRLKPNLATFCESCGASCNECEFGVVITHACGVPQCAKGPGQSCGGPNDIMGKCGDGMYCNCDKCSGCSSKELECAKEAPCLPGGFFPRPDILGRLLTDI